jgi:signal transduction histidine kinase
LALAETAGVADALGNVERATGQMSGMIDELLDLSRLQAGRRLELHREPMDLVGLVAQLIQDQQRTTTVHELRLESPVAELEGFWDPVRLERVLLNLLSNALKYSPQGGVVRVRVGRHTDAADGRDWATVTVEDQGIGIPAAELATIFERFRRGANVPQRTPGAGIGLASAKEIVEQHGGTLTVVSAEGQGACFTVRLPLGSRPGEAS